jgi:N-acetylglucosamine malate deacetylase 2
LESLAAKAVFVLHDEGGHPDHDAASFAVGAACRLIGSEKGSPPRVIEMTSYHAGAKGLEAAVFLSSNLAVKAIALNAKERLRKRRMIECFASQREILARFVTELECFRTAPDYDFAQPPHPGELYYERLGWGITGEIWRWQAKAALEALGLQLRRALRSSTSPMLSLRSAPTRRVVRSKSSQRSIEHW